MRSSGNLVRDIAEIAFDLETCNKQSKKILDKRLDSLLEECKLYVRGKRNEEEACDECGEMALIEHMVYAGQGPNSLLCAKCFHERHRV